MAQTFAFPFDFGDLVTDAISGYVGKVTSACFYPRPDGARVRVEVTARNQTTGAVMSEWFDLEQLRRA
jgi:hypothetical protein